MHPNIRQLARNSLAFTPNDIPLVLERLHSHALKPRMSPEEFAETLQELGFSSVEQFADEVGLPHRTAQSWARFGLSRDSAQLLLALLRYMRRVETAISTIDADLRIGLSDFFEDHNLP